MKKVVSVLVVAVMVLSLAVSAFAASGINKDEEALLTKFKGYVNEYSELSPSHAMQFKNEAENALMKVDLDTAACKELAACMDEVAAYIAEVYATVKEKGLDGKLTARQNAPKALAMINEVAAKYGMSVSLSDTLYATVTFKAAAGKDGANGSAAATDKLSNGGAKIVKQTGADMTATYAVAAVLVVALVFGFAVVSKKNLLSNN